jgi:uncharacterized protein (UPF0335 family)
MTYPNNEFDNADIVVPQSLTETTKEKLRLYIQRLETLEAEKSEVQDQIKDVKADAKALGFDVRAINGVIKYRKIDRKTQSERQMMLDLYLNAVGEI